jgi:hypothetical protein
MKTVKTVQLFGHTLGKGPVKIAVDVKSTANNAAKLTWAKKLATLAPTEPKTRAVKAAKVAKDRDALGGLIGSFAAKVNALLLKSGKSGLTLREAVVALKAPAPQPVSGQLVNLYQRKLATRAENAEGKFCYIAVV